MCPLPNNLLYNSRQHGLAASSMLIATSEQDEEDNEHKKAEQDEEDNEHKKRTRFTTEDTQPLDYELKKRTRTTRQARQTQPFLLTADAALAACLPAIPTSRIETAGDKRSAALHKHTRTTRQATQTQPFLLAASLETIPAEDWVRTWPAGRTIMLRSTSKGVKDVVDKMRLPAVVRLNRGFWNDARHGTAAEKLEIAMRQLPFMTAWAASPHSNCRIVI